MLLRAGCGALNCACFSPQAPSYKLTHTLAPILVLTHAPGARGLISSRAVLSSLRLAVFRYPALVCPNQHALTFPPCRHAHSQCCRVQA
eukprot:2311945-Pleurochrysis_carterae.AAC.1